jgi:hypothetical protein
MAEPTSLAFGQSGIVSISFPFPVSRFVFKSLRIPDNMDHHRHNRNRNDHSRHRLPTTPKLKSKLAIVIHISSLFFSFSHPPVHPSSASEHISQYVSSASEHPSSASEHPSCHLSCASDHLSSACRASLVCFRVCVSCASEYVWSASEHLS